MSPRQHRWRLDVSVVVAAVLVLVGAAVVVLAEPEGHHVSPAAPVEVPLTSAALLCPAGIGGGDQVVAATDVASTQGQFTAHELGGRATPAQVPVATHVASVLTASARPQLLTALGALAPGMAAARWSSSPASLSFCGSMTPDQWFTGISAGPTHDGVLELANASDGTGVVDIDVLSSSGVVKVPQLAGLTVPAQGVKDVDLGQVIPTNDDLAVRVRVTRGQVVATMQDRTIDIASGGTVTEYLTGQTEPSTKVQLLGLAGAASGGTATSTTLVVANPGTEAVTATVQVVTQNAVVTPQGGPTVTVPAGSVGSVSVDQLLATPVAASALGLAVQAPTPVLATLRSSVGGDVALTAPVEALAGPSLEPVPAVAKTLVLRAPTAHADVVVTGWDASGNPAFAQKVGLAPGQGTELALPAGVTLLRVDPGTGPLDAVLLVGGSGVGVAAMRPLRLTGRVVSVHPGLP